MHFFVDDIQACEPQKLKVVPGVQVVLDNEDDSMGLPRVCVSCADPVRLVEYVWDQWEGSIDPEWFSDWVLNRIKCTKVEATLQSGVFSIEWDSDEENLLLVPVPLGDDA